MIRSRAKYANDMDEILKEQCKKTNDIELDWTYKRMHE